MKKLFLISLRFFVCNQLFLSIVLIAILFSLTSFAAICRNPYLQNGASDSMTIMWRTDNFVSGIIEFGETESYGNSVSSLEGNLHEVKLTNLYADTKYFYKLTSDGETKTGWFRTFPNVLSDTPVTFSACGDTRNYTSWLEDDNLTISEWQANFNPYFNLNNGDIVSKGEPLTNSYWQAFFDTTSNLIAQSPVYVVTGNHDYNGSTLSPGYAENFCFPTNGPASLSERVYSFDCGNVHVVCAEIHYDPSPYLPGSEQFTFITNDLATTKNPWKVFLVHNPIFDSGRSGVFSDDSWARVRATNMFIHYLPEFEKYELNLFISGHDHFYERSIKSNTTFLIVSTYPNYDTDQFNPYSAYVNKSGGGVLLSVTGKYMYGTVGHRISGDNIEIIDRFVITNNAIIPEPFLFINFYLLFIIYIRKFSLLFNFL